MNINVTIEKMAKLAVNKSLLKEFSKNGERIVYLNNGDEFQINLFNHYNYTIGADISIDGKSIGGWLIIKPGERIWLERYLDKSSKFKFSTYEVDANNQAVENAIKDNGKIVIKFYKEAESSIATTLQYPYLCQQHTQINPSSKYYFNFNPIQTLYNETTCSLSSNNIEGSITAQSLNNVNANSYTEKNLLLNNNVQKTKETGRVEAGSHSNQEFKNINMLFESFDFCSETIRILPISEKQYNSNDLQKVYCTNCGRKLNSKFKYCPYCGTKCVLI